MGILSWHIFAIQRDVHVLGFGPGEVCPKFLRGCLHRREPVDLPVRIGGSISSIIRILRSFLFELIE